MSGVRFTRYNIVKIMNADKRDDNNVFPPIEINLVHFDKPQLIDRKSKRTSTKQVQTNIGLSSGTQTTLES